MRRKIDIDTEKTENLRLWLTAKVGVSLRLRGNLYHDWRSQREKMIDEKIAFPPYIVD